MNYRYMHACASIIATPFHSHSSLNFLPIFALYFPYIAFRLYLGANTMLYLQSHVVIVSDFKRKNKHLPCVCLFYVLIVFFRISIYNFI